MKVFFFLLFTLLWSCGKMGRPSVVIGETRSFDPVLVDSNSRARFTSLCEALKSRVNSLALSSPELYSFTVTQAGCSGKGVMVTEGPNTVQVLVSAQHTNHLFTPHDSGSFAFPLVETPNVGILGSLCSNLNSLTNPRMDNGESVWLSNTAAGDCVPGGKELCLLVETGKPLGENKFEVVKVEWLKFQMDPSHRRYGFFTERKRVTKGDCGGETFVHARLAN